MSVYSDRRLSGEQFSVDDATISAPQAFYDSKNRALSSSRVSDYKEDYERGATPISSRSIRHPHYEFDDPNYDPSEEVEDDSAYPEVRSAVANTDDPTMPVNTVRMWIIGLTASVIVPGINQFFFFRYPSVVVGQLITQLVTFPLGRLAARFIPRVKVFGVELNPGPFNIKEHVLVTIMAGIGAYSAYATDVVAVQRVWYNQNWSFSYQWMLVMSTQLIGFSMGGVLRRFLVDPPAMIWPSNLVTCALFNTLHSTNYGVTEARGMSREKFFYLALIGSTLWYFVPGYLFTGLSYFSWVCWIVPNNVPVNQMFGYMNGMGMSLITFDWAQITYIGSPLVTPWWAEANVGISFVFFFWILTPILYYTNVWYSSYLPILTRETFDNTGASYNVTRILSADMTFDEAAYKEYSPLFLSATFAVSYGIAFASLTATISHTIIYYRKQIISQVRRSLHEQPDIHARLMSRYPQVPHWWYSAIFVVTFVFGVVCVQAFPTGMPIWAFILALVVAMAYTIPIGIIQAITNQQIGLNVLAELVVGYVLPGRPVPMMLFKTYGYITMLQALSFTADFKLAHYMKIAPRILFVTQVVATIVAGTTQLGVQAWMFSNINGICTTNPVFICASTQVFGAASIIWGVIGPQRQFSSGQIYYGLSFFFLVGAIAPLIPWLLNKVYPRTWWKYINFPVIFSGPGLIPPATALNYVPWLLIGWFFQFFLRRRHFSWWSRYNYVLSAALDSGIAVGAVIIFFALQFPKNGTIGENSILSWWGNTVYLNNADAAGTPFRTTNGTFGPKTW